MNDIWILIPAYNESATIGSVVEKCRRFRREILVVDDGSVDDTYRVARETGCDVLRHESNMGKGAALKTGFQWILDRGCSAVITLDADGQHDPAEIPKFVRLLEMTGGDVILIGSRRGGDRMPLHRALPNRIGEIFVSLAARRHIHDTQSGFRLYSRGVIEKVNCSSKGFEFETEFLIKASRERARIEEISVRTIYKEDYSSNFKSVKDFYRISMIVLRHFL